MNPESGPIIQYGMNRKLELVERGTISLVRALEVIDEHYLKLKSKYDSGEEAIADTLFGFARSKSSFIEICLNKPDRIILKFEHPYRKPILFWHIQAYFQKEIILKSTSRLIEEVTLFFNLSLAEYQMHFAELK